MKKYLLLLCSLVPLASMAQNHHEIGLVGGVASYRGDLNESFLPNEKIIKPTVGVMYKYFFNPRIGIRANLNYIQITGADSLSNVVSNQQRNLSFANDMIELQTGLEINFLQVETRKFRFSPYVFGGIAAYYHNPYTLDNKQKKVFLRDLSTEGQTVPGYPDRKYYSTINASFPFGAGLKAFVGKTVMVTAEVGLRYAASDYLDDVSRSYINLDSLQKYKGIKSVDLSYRGNELENWDGNYPNDRFKRGDFKTSDWYLTATLGFTIYFEAFGNPKRWLQSKCPRIFGRLND